MNKNHRKLLQIAKDLYCLQNQTMYDFQEKIFLDEEPNTIHNKSRQIGISDAYGCRSFLRAYINNYPILVVSPSQRQSTHFMGYVKKYKRLYEQKTGIEIPLAKDAEQTLIFEDGGEIYSLPNQANTVRGFPADEIILDEFAHFLHDTDKAVLQAIEPSLTRGGSLTIISTPFGTENEYHTIWDSKDLYTDFKRELIHWTQCPDVDANRINQIKLRDPLTYAQEYDNKFIEDVDEAEFPFSLIKKCINMELDFEELSTRKTYVGGVDIGRKHDLTASVFNERVDNKYIVRHINTMHNTKYKEQKSYYQFLLKNYVFEYIKMDATGLGNNLVEDLKDDFPDIVIPVEFDNQKKQDMVMNLKELMFNGELQFPNDASLINNIRSIKRMFTTGGFLKFDSDRSSDIGHADLFWALALSVYQESGGTTFFGLE